MRTSRTGRGRKRRVTHAPGPRLDLGPGDEFPRSVGEAQDPATISVLLAMRRSESARHLLVGAVARYRRRSSPVGHSDTGPAPAVAPRVGRT